MIRRSSCFFLGGENVEFAGIEHQFAAAAGEDRLPIILDGTGALLVDVDQPGMAFGAIADQPVAKARQIDRDGDAAREGRIVGRDQP